MRDLKKGLLLAITASILFTTQSFAEKSETTQVKPVKCQGVNACRGKAMCGTTANACAGQNACKGKGWIFLAPQICAKKGGTVVK